MTPARCLPRCTLLVIAVVFSLVGLAPQAAAGMPADGGSPGGRAVFDSWRILMFARSIGDDSVDREALRVAAADTTSIVQIGPDTFAWANRRYEVTWDV